MSNRVQSSPFRAVSRSGSGDAVLQTNFRAEMAARRGQPVNGDARQNIIANRKAFFGQQQQAFDNGKSAHEEKCIAGRSSFSSCGKFDRFSSDDSTQSGDGLRSMNLSVHLTVDDRIVSVGNRPSAENKPETYFQRHLKKILPPNALHEIIHPRNAPSDTIMLEYSSPSSDLHYSRSYKSGDVLEIYPSYVLDPGCIFVVDDPGDQLADYLVRLAEDMKDAATGSARLKLHRLPTESMVVAAYCSRYKEWCRGEILEHVGDSSAHVVFLDYGNAEVVKLADMRPMTPEWMGVPRMTLPVELKGVVRPTVGNDYSKAEILQARNSMTNRLMNLEILQVLPHSFVGKLQQSTHNSSSSEPRSM